MYSFAQRSDTQVYDEPLYAYYLKNTPAAGYHPGAKEVLASVENDGNKVIDMMMGHHHKPVVFFNHMTHHLLDLDRSFMKHTLNIILTRDPVEMLPSFAKVIENPTMDDVGYALHIRLMNDLHKMKLEPIVIDSKKILINPKKLLTTMCNVLGIPFDEHMLAWDAGPRKEDGVWAKYWYGNVHESKGFMEYKPNTTPFPEELKPLLQTCLPYYEQLMKRSI
jgi:hypothetical protein